LVCVYVSNFASDAALEEMPVAIETDTAKAQHYELPTKFFKLVLGRNLKYRFVLHSM
jgi:cyclopropane fatty-acyl-phospholipid synthase-like methyltransferase